MIKHSNNPDSRHKRYERYRNIEVEGVNIRNVTDSFRLLPEIGLKPLWQRGIGRVSENGDFVVDASGWYPLPEWLEAFDEILHRVGPSKMTEIGCRIPANSTFPPSIDTLPAALAALDAAYHLNHRRDGQVMLELTTGRMLDGIGHYRCTIHDNGGGARVECDALYPCDLDRGLFYGLGRRFRRSVSVRHDQGSGCRATGHPRCVYDLRWS